RDTRHALCARHRLFDVTLAVQSLLWGEELGVREVLQVVHDRNARNTGAPEGGDGEGAEDQVGLKVRRDLSQRRRGAQASIDTLHADTHARWQDPLEQLARASRRARTGENAASTNVVGIERRELDVAVAGSEQGESRMRVQ